MTLVAGLMVMRDTLPLDIHPLVGPGGLGQESPAADPQVGAVPPIDASYPYATYRYGDAGKFGSRVKPSSPESPKSYTFSRRSATVTGGAPGLLRLNSLIVPLLSPMKTRPSVEIAKAVGRPRPDSTVWSKNPGGSVPAAASRGAADPPVASAASATSSAANGQRNACVRPRPNRSTKSPHLGAGTL